MKLYLFPLLAIFALLGMSRGSDAASALEQLAASMAPGTWAQLTTATNQNSALGAGPTTGSMLPYSNTMPWNPLSKRIEILALDHNYAVPLGSAVGARYVQYDALTNQFIFVGDQPDIPGIGHGFDHVALNPNTGDLYWRVYSGFTGRISVKKKTFGVAGFVNIPSVAASDQVAIGTTWWSGPFVGGGSQGSYMIFNTGNAFGNANDGQVLAYNPLTNTWFYNQVGKAPFYGGGATYGSVMEYSTQKNVAVYGGGDVSSNKLWRLNADGTSVPMPNVPAGKTVGIQKGNLVPDPVTGNFLLLSRGELWELNPDGAGSWTQKATPPSGVGNPSSPELANMISSAISDYGVVAYIKQPTTTGGTFYLYKNAATGPADTTAPTVSLTAPAGATVSGAVTVWANATDNTGIAGVQFKLDGANLASEDVTAPYSITWNTTTVPNGTHTLTAVARDAAGNQTTSSPVTVTVSNIVDTTPDAFGFTPQTGAALNTVVTSYTITPAGYNAAASISVSGGSYSINGGAFVTTPGTISPGQSVAVRLTASDAFSTASSAALTIGGTVASFSVTTQAGSGPPSAPTGMLATGGIGAITVKFAAPASAGSAPIVGFTARCVSNNGGVPGSNGGDATATSIRIDGLTNGKTYTCTVSAKNAFGDGAPTASSNSVTPFDLSPILNLLLDQ